LTEHKLPALIGPLTPAQIAAKMASGHSVFSPSGGEMTMTCEDSLWLNAVAEDRQTYEAAEGTVAHELGEQWVITDKRPDDRIGEIVEIKGFEIEITDDMIAYVEDYYDLCQETKIGMDEWGAEKWVSTEHLTPIPGQGGTSDFRAMRPGKLVIVDLKYGKEPVFATSEDEDGKLIPNKQLGVYASANFREYDWLYHFEEIEIVICQPRLPIPISRHTFTRQELLDFEDYARAKWALCWRPRELLTRTPSLKGCRWCAVRATCPALYLFLANEHDVFDEFDDDGNVIEGTYSVVEMAKANEIILDDLSPSPFPDLPKPAELSTEAMAKLLRYRKLMENFFNSLEQELLHRAISLEQDIPYWKLVESRTRRKPVDDTDHIVEVLEAKGLKRKDLFKQVMLSPAQIEELLHKKLKLTKAEAKRWLDNSGLVVKPPGTKTLAAISDNRAALPKDGDVFVNWDAPDDEDDI
jgi:hypothetical protein